MEDRTDSLVTTPIPLYKSQKSFVSKSFWIGRKWMFWKYYFYLVSLWYFFVEITRLFSNWFEIIVLVVNTCMSASGDSLDTYRSKWADLFKRTKAVRDVSVKSGSKFGPPWPRRTVKADPRLRSRIRTFARARRTKCYIIGFAGRRQI